MAQEINENGEARKMHDRLDETRWALSEKVEAFKDRVKDTVDTTRETVEETMQSVKQSVQEALESIKSTFDIKLQTQKHPLSMLSGSVVLGVFISHLTDRDSNSSKSADKPGRPSYKWAAPSQPSRDEPAASSSSAPSLGERLTSQLHDEISRVQQLAIGVGFGIFRDWVKKAMPSIATKIEEVIDSATSKMGGEPVQGPFFRQKQNGHGEHEQ